MFVLTNKLGKRIYLDHTKECQNGAIEIDSLVWLFNSMLYQKRPVHSFVKEDSSKQRKRRK